MIPVKGQLQNPAEDTTSARSKTRMIAAVGLGLVPFSVAPVGLNLIVKISSGKVVEAPGGAGLV